MSHPRESKNSARRVRAAENKVKCLRMIVAGVSRADIAKQLGVTKKTICIYVQQSMAELNEERLQLATQVYDLEQERLEALLRALESCRDSDTPQAYDQHIRIVRLIHHLIIL